MKVQRLGITIEQQTESERAAAVAERNRAVQEYNIMMGLLEDPSEDDTEGEEDE